MQVSSAQGDRLDSADRQGGQCAEGDQRVHVGGAVAQQPAGVAEERPATDQLDEDRQAEHGPSGSGRLGGHECHDQCCEGERPGDRHPQSPVVVLVIDRAVLVSGGSGRVSGGVDH